jgi:hypothetical protein
VVPAVTAITSELAGLIVHLSEALHRDNTTEGRLAGILAGLPVNGDVLHAMVTLHREVPVTTRRAGELAGEPWQMRDLGGCLLALGRFIDRIYQIGPPGDAMALEDQVHWWVRVTKIALGLRTPDIPLPRCVCPVCTHGRLFAAGSEGFLRENSHGVTVEWEQAGRVYCTACTAVWSIGQWPLLGRMLEAV